MESRIKFRKQVNPATRILPLLMILCVLTAVPTVAFTAQIKLAWDPVTTGATEGYKLFARFEGEQYDYQNPIWSGNTASATIDNLEDNATYYFVVRSVSGDAVSGDSNEVNYQTSAPAPSVPVPTSPAATPAPMAPIIIDNGGTGTSSAGSWKISGGSDPYGSESLYSKSVGANYTYTSDLTGRYEVAVWWSSFSSRCSSVPVNIYSGSTLLDSVTINQSQNGGKWNVLGSYDFGGQARVVVTAQDTSCSTCADAVEFSGTGDAGTADNSTGTGDTGTVDNSTGTADSSNDPSNDNAPQDTSDPADTAGDVAVKIIDNGDKGTSSMGNWKSSGGSNPFGGGSLYSKDVGASYTYTSDLTGRHKVALWWSGLNSRCSDVPVEIYDDDLLLDAISVNQSKNAGRWNVLGSYDFSGRGHVVVVASDSKCSTCADAVEFSNDVDDDNTIYIIDNEDSRALSTGSWKVSSGTNPYGDGSLYSKDVGASYSFTSLLNGRYKIALWWSDLSSRCPDVPVEIYDDDRLVDTISVDQSQNGGRWNVLGNYDFTGHARVSVVAHDKNCSTCADAVLYSK